MPSQTIESNHALSVTELTTQVKQTLAQTFSMLWVNGEISNLSQPASGHIYFSLKDQDSQVRCAMFKSRKRGLQTALQDGMQVIVYARLDLYAARGDFQLIIERIEEAGKGLLRQNFEALKNKLLKEGLFDQTRKLPIPLFPKTIGVITSPKGAAIKDILKTLRNTSMPMRIIIYPTVVQGSDAPASITQALQTAMKRNETETLIMARGGGSFEDLQAFNDEKLVRTMSQCAIPIITGVGHDIDFTLVDFVADFRAATPTAAAHKACPNASEIKTTLYSLQQRMQKSVTHNLLIKQQNTKILLLHLKQHNPLIIIEHLMQRLDDLSNHFVHAFQHSHNQRTLSLISLHARWQKSVPLVQLFKCRNQVETMQMRLNSAIHIGLSEPQQKLSRLSAQIKSLNPLAVLKRGFAVVTSQRNKIISHPEQAPPGTDINIQLATGEITALVKSKKTK